MGDEELLEHISECLASGEDVYVRILTHQEMVDKGLLRSTYTRPSYWNSLGEMDYLFGETVRVKHVDYYETPKGGIGIEARYLRRGSWFIEVGHFELMGSTTSKVTLDDIKDFIKNKFNKLKTKG